MPKIILCGTAGSGKDTVAEIIGYPQFAFADEIRLLAKNLRINGVSAAMEQLRHLCDRPFDLPVKLQEFLKIPKVNEKDRDLLVALGEYLRKHDEDIWIRVVRKKVDSITNVIVTDCRRANELESFMDFTSIYIDADLSVRHLRLKHRDGSCNMRNLLQQTPEIEVETLKDRCDFVIENNGTLKDLREEVKRCLKLVTK